MKINWQSLFVPAFLFAAIGAFIAPFALAQELEDQLNSPSDQAVKIDGTVTLRGVLDPIETLRLATRDPGIVTRVLVSEGSKVRSGEVIAELDTEMYQAELSSALNEMEIARQETKNDVDLQYAKISTDVNEQVLTRSRRAAEQFAKSVSTTELERLRLEYERSRLSGLQAERQQSINLLNENLKKDRLEIAELRLKNRQIRSEIDGTVVQVYHTPGEFVNTGEPIARILNLNRLRVICNGDARVVNPADLAEDAIFKIKLGDKEAEYVAKITFVSPEIDPVRQTYSIWAEVQNPDGALRSGNVGDLEVRLK